MTLHLLQTLIRYYIAANLTWLVSEGSFVFHHASTANSCNQSQWGCTRILAVVSRADSDPDSRIWHAGSRKKKITGGGSVIRRKEKHDRPNDSFPCVCAPPSMFTLILCKIYSIYFDDKRLKFIINELRYLFFPQVWNQLFHTIEGKLSTHRFLDS